MSYVQLIAAAFSYAAAMGGTYAAERAMDRWGVTPPTVQVADVRKQGVDDDTP